MAAGFYRYETKPLILQINPPSALEDIKELIVTIAQNYNGAMVQIEKTKDTISIDAAAGKITLGLSQEETAAFTVGEARVQVNILYTDDERDTTVQGTIQVYDNLHKEIME